MSRHNDQRLNDILASAAAIADHIKRGELDDGLVFDAVRVRLIEIGEAVKAIDPELLAHEPNIPWIDIAGMRNHLAHRYFDTTHAMVQATVAEDLPPLVAAVERLLEHLGVDPTL
ncbi:MAG: HepT-like ribonuclease domain-containing protein [Pseudonocardiaceae bacterium]